MQIVSKGDNLHGMSNPIFQKNIWKIIFQNYLLKFLLSMQTNLFSRVEWLFPVFVLFRSGNCGFEVLLPFPQCFSYISVCLHIDSWNLHAHIVPI